MAIHLKAFREELYREHLEEAAFKYETRQAWLDDPELGWLDLEDLENGIEAHLDALLAGGTLAKNTCLKALEEEEAPLLHIATRLFCKSGDSAQLNTLLRQLTEADSESIRAFADALKWECPEAMIEGIWQVFIDGRSKLYPLLSDCVAYRTPHRVDVLVKALESETQHSEVLVDAIAHCQKPPASALAPLYQCLNQNNEKLSQKAALAIVRSGDLRLALQLQAQAETFPFVLALAGDEPAFHALLESCKLKPSNDALLALGLGGKASALPVILKSLNSDELADSAALALNLITGANLYEDVHIPEDMEQEELFEHEQEAFKRGEIPKNIDGLPFGAEVKKLSTDIKTWHNWIKPNLSQLKPEQRYRYGKVFSPEGCYRCLISNQLPADIRQLIHTEMCARLQVNIPFCARDTVRNQQQQLMNIRQWLMNRQS